MSFSEKKTPLKTATEILTCVPPSLLCGDSTVLSLCHCPVETIKDVFQAEIKHAVCIMV